MDSSALKFSIVTPTFNQGKFLERTIKSVLSQDYPNVEYIVMDGGSTDNTKEILKRYEKRIVWRSEKDHGQADAINKGFKVATGDILAYLNSDDIYLPGCLRKVAEYFKKYQKTQWLFGKCKIVDENDKERRKVITHYKNFWLNRYHYQTLLMLDYISQPATFWRHEAYRSIGDFNENEYWELDYDYWLRLGKKFKPGFVNHYLANFRVHQQSKTSVNAKHFSEEIRVAKKYTKNPLLIGGHYLNFLSIVVGYNLLSKIKR